VLHQVDGHKSRHFKPSALQRCPSFALAHVSISSTLISVLVYPSAVVYSALIYVQHIVYTPSSTPLPSCLLRHVFPGPSLTSPSTPVLMYCHSLPRRCQAVSPLPRASQAAVYAPRLLVSSTSTVVYTITGMMYTTSAIIYPTSSLSLLQHLSALLSTSTKVTESS
jgi:hypothetical protein